MSAINLGGFSIIGGKLVSTGLASGLDTENLVKGIIEAKQIPVTKLEDKKTLTSDKLSAYGGLKNTLSALKTTADFLRNPPSLISANSNLFAYRNAFISSNTSVSGNTYIGVEASPNSAFGKFTVEDVVLAKARVLRSNTFTSQTDSVTDAAGTNNAGHFSAGAFQITGGKIKPVVGTSSSDTLIAADLSTTGTVGTSALNSAFGTNGITFSTGGDFALIGDASDIITNVTATQTGGVGTGVTLTVTINGKSYKSNTISANSGGGSNQIAANTTILLTEATTGASFQIQTGAAITIANGTDLSNFADNVETDLQPLSFYQKREISNFDLDATTGTTLDGLNASHVTLKSNEFDKTTGQHGKIEAFHVTAVSAPGAGDGKIEVVIDGETYRATGLGNGADVVNGNITLNSLTSSKSFSLALGDAAVSLDLSSASSAQTIERDLNNVFGTGVEVTIKQGDSLLNIANAINAKKTETGVSATIIQVGTNDFRLSIQSETTGVENSFNLVDVNEVFTSTVTLTETQAASDASFTLNGDLSITRSTNTITDVVNGLTFTLFQDTPAATELTVDISHDIESATDSIISFLNAYNDFRTFVAKQSERDADGNLKDTAVIGSESLLKTAESRFEQELNTVITALTAGDPTRLADVGITFTDFEGDDENPPVGNIITLDQSKLSAALQSNFEAVQRVFGFTFESTSTALSVSKRTNALSINDFSLDIDITRATGDKVRVTYTDPTTGLPTTINADFKASTGTGGTITGQKGTVLEGLTLIYTGDGTDVIDVSVSQGVADRIYNAVDDFVKSGGLIDTETTTLTDSSTRLQQEIDNLNSKIDEERLKLLDKFSLLESIIDQSNQLIAFLDAQLKAFFASNG